MTKKQIEQICELAIRRFGRESQIKKIQEECLELALAISRKDCETKQLEDTTFQIYDEIADVTIMMIMAQVVYDGKRIQERVNLKLAAFKKKYLKEL